MISDLKFEIIANTTGYGFRLRDILDNGLNTISCEAITILTILKILTILEFVKSN